MMLEFATRNPMRSRLACLLGALMIGGILAAAPKPARAQVVVVVNGSPITALDVEHRMRLNQLTQRKPPNKQEATKELIDEKLKLFIAKRYGLEPAESETEQTFADMAKRGRMTPQQFGQQLAANGVPISAFKEKIGAESVWNQLVRGKFGSALQVGESDVQTILRDKTDDKDAVGYLYILRPILFIVPRGSPNALYENKRREAEALRSRFTSCDEGVKLARQLQDVAVREPVTRSSADVSPDLREILAKLEIGRLTTPELVQEGFQLFALCEKKQSTADAPNKRDARNKLFAQRFEAEAKKFLDEVRRTSMIEYR